MGRRPGLGKETSTSTGFPERHSSVIAPAGHHCNVRSGHLNATFGGKDMGSMAQTGLLLVPSDALGHTWALPGALGAGQGLPPETGPEDLNMAPTVARGRPHPENGSVGGASCSNLST